MGINIQPVTRFTKTHAFELSCAAVAAASILVWAFGIPYVLPSASDVSNNLKERAKGRQSVAGTVNNMWSAKPNLEGVDVATGVKDSDLTATDKLTDMKAAANSWMKSETTQMETEAADRNRVGRVDPLGRPLFGGQVIEVVDGFETPKDPNPKTYLPRRGMAHNVANENIFYDKHYTLYFQRLSQKLTGNQNPEWGMVPSVADLDAEFIRQAQAEAKRLDPIRPMPAVPGGGPVAIDPKKRDDFKRTHLVTIANRTPIYVDTGATFLTGTAFQKRAMGGGTFPPTPAEVFEGYVDCWLQTDVVEAIYATNKVSDGLVASRQVATSPIKRLVSISVGPAALTPFTPFGGSTGVTGTGIFVHAPMAVPPVAAGAVPPAPSAPTPQDFAFSMTGRTGNERYHVVPMTISIVCEPNAANRFVKELYTRNNGYTVINRRDTTVDPYEAASQGFLYGRMNEQGETTPVACVKVDLLVECLLFRTWIDPIMPARYGVGGSAP